MTDPVNIVYFPDSWQKQTRIYQVRHEKNIPPVSQKTQTQTRFPGPDGDGRRAENSVEPPPPGAGQVDGLIGRTTAQRDSSTHEECFAMPDGDARQSCERRRNDLPRRGRLVHSSLFAECRVQRQRYPGQLMVLCLRSGSDAALRLGVVASRSLGGAVTRNRAKRRLREVFRLCRPQLCGAYDVILLARTGINRASAQEICGEFLRLARQARILSNAG